MDYEIPVHWDSHASSSHEVSLEPILKRREDLCKHSVKTHFPKDRNCEICKWTKIARAPCRRRNGAAVPRAENFGDFVTADHKVPGDNCESRNNHRYAVVAQDLATQWIQAYPCKTKTSQETQRSLQKFLEPEWESMPKLKEKQKWSNEKLHLDNARKLRRIYFIDPEDKEFRETIKNARKNLEASMAPAMPCKVWKRIVRVVHPIKLKNKTCVYSGS